MADLRRQSIKLCDFFVEEVEKRCPMLVPGSPRDGEKRGSQISFLHEEGYAIMQALIDRGVIGDFRAPNAIRFGFAPLYNGEGDVLAAVDILAEIMQKRLWDTAEYRRRALVT